MLRDIQARTFKPRSRSKSVDFYYDEVNPIVSKRKLEKMRRMSLDSSQVGNSELSKPKLNRRRYAKLLKSWNNEYFTAIIFLRKSPFKINGHSLRNRNFSSDISYIIFTAHFVTLIPYFSRQKDSF